MYVIAYGNSRCVDFWNRETYEYSGATPVRFQSKTMQKPPLIFKYMPEPRFLDNRLFRFSQPEALNDPFEARPELEVGKFSPEDIEEARRTAERAGHGDISDEDLIVFHLNPYPALRNDELSFPELWPASEPRLREEPFTTIAEFDRAIGCRAVELGIALANRTIGILSLSESTEDNMWAHYADEHCGVRVEFDTAHPYFERGNLRPMTYSDQPFQVTVKDGWVRLAGHTVSNEDVLSGNLKSLPEELFWRKRLSWSYEQEWRMIKRLVDADEIKPGNQTDVPVCLFRIPPEAIVTLTFGYRATEDAIKNACCRIEHDSRWNHLSVSRRVQSTTNMTEEIVRHGHSGGDAR